MYAPRHVRPAPRRRQAMSALAVASLTAAGLAAAPAGSANAAADPTCLQPRVADVMVNQGLPSYKTLVRGKSALVKFFMQVPSCAPAGTTMRITQGALTVNGAATNSVPLAITPLTSLAPSSTSPVPASQGDPLFLLTGSQLTPSSADNATLTFSAAFKYTYTTNGITSPEMDYTAAKRPDGLAITATVAKASNPLRVLTVAMGDTGTALVPNAADSQFTDTDKTNLTAGLTALNRILPVPDGVGSLTAGSGGLRTSMAAGLLNIGPYKDGSGKFCGTDANYSAVERDLNNTLSNYNSVNPVGQADRVLGVVSGAISSGGTTGQAGCADGYASLPGTAAWARVVTRGSTNYTGTIAGMELLHSVGGVARDYSLSVTDDRYIGGHSKNPNADKTAPDRAWNIADKSWMQKNWSVMNYQPDGRWNDATSLFEQEDYDNLHCQLTPVPAGQPSPCPIARSVGSSSPVGASGSSFFFSGSTDGTAAGTEAHTYVDDDANYDTPVQSSVYRFVQRDSGGAVIQNDGFEVSFTESHHDGGQQQEDSPVGSFASEFQADSRATRLELWKGDPAAAGSVLLHGRDRDQAPAFLAVSARGRTVTVNVQDNTPQNLRLDVFDVCPGVVLPVVSAVKPVSTTSTGQAVFTTPADPSLGCTNGRLRYRVTDGYLVAEQDDNSQPAPGATTGTAAIYAPLTGDVLNSSKVLGLAGDGRDALGRPAAALTWTLTGPSFPSGQSIAVGSSSYYVPPKAGLVPGGYTLTLKAYDVASPTATTTPIATASRSYSVLADTDQDGILDRDETQPCYGPDAVTDQLNAVLDSDYDGIPNVNDPQPCLTANTAAATFTPNSYNTGSSGNFVKMRLSNSQIDLTKVNPAEVAITQISGYRLAKPFYAISFVATSPTDATGTFDRGALAAFISTNQIKGLTPIYVTAPSAGLRAGDAQSPNTF